MKIQNKLPRQVEIVISEDDTIVIPEATEDHDDDGCLIVVFGEVELTEGQAAFFKAEEFSDEISDLLKDGALILTEETNESVE